MTEGIMSETVDQVGLMIDVYKELQATKPGHELLKVASLHPDGNGIHFNLEYFKRFTPGIKHNIQGYMRYTDALKDALYR
jgi:hypothetical protein